jgi:hypothetical protein
VKALGADVVEGIISVDTVPNEKAASYKVFDEVYRKETGEPASSNSFAAMTWDSQATQATMASSDAASLDWLRIIDCLQSAVIGLTHRQAN